MVKVIIGVLLCLSHLFLYFKGHNDGVAETNLEMSRLSSESVESKIVKIEKSNCAPSEPQTESNQVEQAKTSLPQVAIEPDVVEDEDLYRNIAAQDDEQVLHQEYYSGERPYKNEEEILEAP